MDTIASVMTGVMLLMCLYLFWLWFCFGNYVKRRQKTRNPQQRRMYVGSRARPSLGQADPPIYVSPSSYPPPPKYEALAPPSYDEVVGVHYPNYPIQPITQPISAALAQSASNSSNPPPTQPPAVVTVTNEERRTSVARS